MAVKTTPPTLLPTLTELGESFRRSLLAENKSPKTIKSYMEAIRFFDRYLGAQGMLVEISAIRREHVEAWIANLLNKLET